MSRSAAVRWYYAATPLFALADVLLGASVRAAWIPSTGWRLAYYVFALACFIVMSRRPAWTSFIGLGESAVNLFLVLFSVLGPLFALPDAVVSGEEIAYRFGIGRLVNVLLAGSVLILSIHRHGAALTNLQGHRPRR